MTLQVLDPTNETAPPLGQLAPRLASLAGRTVGFISNGKKGTAGFFGHLDRIPRSEFGVAEVIHRRKSNYSVPADLDIVDELRRWQAAVTGIDPSQARCLIECVQPLQHGDSPFAIRPRGHGAKPDLGVVCGDSRDAELFHQLVEADTARGCELLEALAGVVGEAKGHDAHGNFSRHSDGVKIGQPGP